MVYYNEFAQYPAQWLRNLFPDADVDDRSICDVGIGDVAGYEQVHLFAGIGGWSYALHLAEWPLGEPVWTGSCPCQPFSRCGKKEGKKDVRHLWPEMFRLIDGNQPPVVFGEQVASKSGLEWLDGVCHDLEGIGYTCGKAVLTACGVGAPHRRERIFWVADTKGAARVRPIGRGNTRMDYRIVGAEWGDYRPYDCRDGKVRRVEPGVLPLAARLPGDLDRLLAWGNSIVPQVGAVFIRSYMEARGITPQSACSGH